MIKKVLFGIFIVVITAATVVLSLGPDYAKGYIEEHDMELIGRKITINEIDFNAFNGHFIIDDFKIFEKDESVVFVKFDTLYTDLALYKLFKGEFLTEALHVKGLNIGVWAQNEVFNFTDLIPVKDSSSIDTTNQDKESFIKKFTINDIQILYSEVVYEDKDLGAYHELKDINILKPNRFTVN